MLEMYVRGTLYSKDAEVEGGRKQVESVGVSVEDAEVRG